MAIFDIEGYTSKESADLVNLTQVFHNYSFRGLYEGLSEGYFNYGMTPLGIIPMTLNGIFGSKTSQGIMSWSGLKGAEDRSYQAVLDTGWERISAAELGYQGKEDQWNAFVGEHPLFRSAQADVLGFRDEQGQLTKMSVIFRGITGERENLIIDTLMDAVNTYNTAIKTQPDYLTKAFNGLLQSVADFAQDNGLESEDILVTGYSLGGSLVTNMALMSEDEWGGFFKDSVYISQASPRIESDSGSTNILNIGLENDPVYRATDSGKIMLFNSLFVHDQEYDNSMLNVVGFNDLYAGKAGLLNWLPYSVASLPSWVSHMGFSYETAVRTIIRSEFYELTELDSVIVVSSLSDVTRGKTWVEDIQAKTSSHYGESAFILGSDSNDLLRGGAGNDRLEGFGGDDRFQFGGGHNIVAGGEGSNTVELTLPLGEYSISRDAAGTVYLYHAEQGTLNTLYNVQYLSDNTEKGATYHISDEGLLSEQNASLVYEYATTAMVDDSNAELTLDDGGWLFGSENDDILTGGTETTLFFGGAGNDIFYSQADDIFIFNDEAGHNIINGFDAGDRIQFVGIQGFRHIDDLFANLEETEQGTRLSYGLDSSVLLAGITGAELNMEQFIFV